MSTTKTTVADIVNTGLTAARNLAAGAPIAGAAGAIEAVHVAEAKEGRLPPPPTREGYEADLLDD
jgi:hypothetical protein